MAGRATKSPLAVFLDYILTAPLADGKAALEASIAALGARQRMQTASGIAPAAARVAKPVAAAVAAPGVVAAPTGPVAVPTPARRRGRPAKPVAAAPAAVGTTPARRRGRPPVTAAPPAVASEIIDLPPAGNPLPEQTTIDEAYEQVVE